MEKITGRKYNETMGKLHFYTMFVGVNITFFPMHFLGLAGIEISNNVEYPHMEDMSYLSLIASCQPYGPHILPKYLSDPVRIYKPKLDRNLIGVENKNRTIIYQ